MKELILIYDYSFYKHYKTKFCKKWSVSFKKECFFIGKNYLQIYIRYVVVLLIIFLTIRRFFDRLFDRRL